MAKKKKKKTNNLSKNKSNHKKKTTSKKKISNRTTSKKVTKKQVKSITPIKETINEELPQDNKKIIENKTNQEENVMADDFVKEFAPNYFKIAISSIIWAIIIIIVAIWSIDLYRTINHQNPKLCLSQTIYEYDDGTITECNGLGYNIYHYERDEEDKFIFRPFFIEYKIEK